MVHFERNFGLKSAIFSNFRKKFGKFLKNHYLKGSPTTHIRIFSHRRPHFRHADVKEMFHPYILPSIATILVSLIHKEDIFKRSVRGRRRRVREASIGVKFFAGFRVSFYNSHN